MDFPDLPKALATFVRDLVVIVAAAAPFAPNSYSRARLLRQMHASGLLGEIDEAPGAPR